MTWKEGVVAYEEKSWLTLSLTRKSLNLIKTLSSTKSPRLKKSPIERKFSLEGLLHLILGKNKKKAFFPPLVVKIGQLGQKFQISV